MSRPAGALGLWLVVLAHAGPALAQGPAASPRYAAAIEAELQRMGIAAQCAADSPARHVCRAARPAAGAAGELSLHVVYSDESDTVYFYLARYLVLPSDDPRAPSVLRRLMELNWDLLVGKFEWDARTGEIRLGAVLNTDSNFDRRAFRSIIGALDATAARYAAELRDLALR